jgi:hypothetical protein
MLEERFKPVFVDRAIDLDLAAVRDRPYVDLEDVFQADPNYRDLEPGQLRFLDLLMEQSDGIVMVRHAPPLKGIDLPPIFAELRPLDAVLTSTRRHNFIDKNGMFWAHHTKPYERLTRGWQKHVARDEALDDHRRVNNPDEHQHENRAKYLFPPGVHREVPWKNHEHAAMTPDKLEAHLGRYEHPDGSDTIHFKRTKDPAVNRAKRIDVHPWAVEKLVDAEVVYFALEGCLKADAILTEILRTGERASVCSVPSVTLWDCREFTYFVQQYVKGRICIIIPDADWQDERKGGAILSQALYCRSAIEELVGRNQAFIAAPPECLGHVKTKGIDDYLRAGGKLHDLKIIDRRPPEDMLVYVFAGPTKNPNGRRRDRAMLRFLSLHADNNGEYSAPLLTIARRVTRKGMDRGAVRQALMNLEEAEAITSDKPLTTTSRQWIRWPEHNPYGAEWGMRGWFVNRDQNDSWRDTPTFTVDPRYRSEPGPERTVGEVVSKRAR